MTGKIKQSINGESQSRAAQSTVSNRPGGRPLSIKIKRNQIHVGSALTLVLRRTLRVPDRQSNLETHELSPLPPNLGALPVHRISDFAERLPINVQGREGFFVPLRAREALWLDFIARSPHAVKVAVGGVNAVTGGMWSSRLEEPQDYLVCPPQEWLDGIRTARGTVRQFVAMPLGSGYSVEAQVEGRERKGGLEILVFRPKPGRISKMAFEWGAAGLESLSNQGLAAGGEIAQRIHPDPYGLDVWDQTTTARLSIDILDEPLYRSITGRDPPSRPPTAEDYTAAGLPWFVRLDEAFGDLSEAAGLSRLQSIAELDEVRSGTRISATTPSRALSPRITRLRYNHPSANGEETIMNLDDADRKAVITDLLPDRETLERSISVIDAAAAGGQPEDALPSGGRRSDEAGFENLETLEVRAQSELAPILSDETRQQRRRIIGAGQRALDKRKRSSEAQLTTDEQLGLEAIVVLTGRPALLVQGGTFAAPPDRWSILYRPDVRSAIERNIGSVGRIEVEGHPYLEWIGTGFLVADDVIMTNRHVAMEFARTADGQSWEIQPKMKIKIDYVEELGATAKAEFKITEIIGIHDEVDMALLRVSRRGASGIKKPDPLPLAAAPKLSKKQQVYVIGYPASDSRRNDPIEMRRIFENIFDVKRLQPGEITGSVAGGQILKHDCSTLGGNSGSCVVDLETHQVVGLHFGGRYLVGNSAVALSKLQSDPLVKKAGLRFD